ncbi:MAG: carbonic anhydrase [Acidiferrobacteraceae bacterium]
MSSIETLVAGFFRFRARHFGQDDKLFKKLVSQGQSPKVIVVGCCDSRVDPAIITDAEPGDLFIIRNIANLVPPCESAGTYHGTSAALEFGVCRLGVEHIIVLGHAQCGGIHALLEGGPWAGAFISAWTQIAEPARERAIRMAEGEDLHRSCEQEAILVSLDNLLTFPWIRERVEQARLVLHGWYFDLEAGQLLYYDKAAGKFQSF